MDHNDHVNLLRPAKLAPGIYADLGAGSGAFTLALRELIGNDSTIYAVDKDSSSLKSLEHVHAARFRSTSNLFLLPTDFSRPLNIPALDGVVMANSLHFFKDKVKVLEHVRSLLKPKGILLVVEYNVDSGNMWVPYPFSFDSFRTLAARSGFDEPHLLAKTPSRFLREFYSATCLVK
jgi:ubiquinone/menaquinone biosynthesis C-methylase UbiE